MNILLDEAYRQLAEERLAGHELRYYPSGLADPAKFAEMLVGVDILCVRRAPPFRMEGAVFDRADRLEFIQKSGSGDDHFNIAELSRLGILLALNTGFNAVSVAEHAVTLILVCLRRTGDFADVVRSGGWLQLLPGDQPIMLSGKTVGLIGIGAIGTRIARAMLALEAKVIAYHPDPQKPMPPGVNRASLDTLLSTADVVSLQTPLTAATVGMIGRREIGLLKSTAVLINTSRGAVIDQVALLDALRDHRIRAAGLDVFAEEPLVADHPLRTLPNVFATPHIGGVVKETIELQVEGSISNVELYVSGRRPQRLINSAILESGSARARHLIDAAS